MEHINKYSHIYFVVFTIIIVVYNLAYHYVNGDGILLSEGDYHRSVKVDDKVNFMSNMLVSKCQSEDDICKIQSLLDYVTNIPYTVNNNQAFKPIDIIEKNYGDCDDKSNLLISLLKSLNYKAYFVFVSKHVYVIVNIPNDNKNKLEKLKSYKINSLNYYTLESTAKDSKIGFPIQHSISEIIDIVDPFSKEKIDLDRVLYE